MKKNGLSMNFNESVMLLNFGPPVGETWKRCSSEEFQQKSLQVYLS